MLRHRAGRIWLETHRRQVYRNVNRNRFKLIGILAVIYALFYCIYVLGVLVSTSSIHIYSPIKSEKVHFDLAGVDDKPTGLIRDYWYSFKSNHTNYMYTPSSRYNHRFQLSIWSMIKRGKVVKKHHINKPINRIDECAIYRDSISSIYLTIGDKARSGTDADHRSWSI